MLELYLPAVGPGSSLGCSAPHQSFGLWDDDWLRWECGDLNYMGGAVLEVGGALRFG